MVGLSLMEVGFNGRRSRPASFYQSRLPRHIFTKKSISILYKIIFHSTCSFVLAFVTIGTITRLMSRILLLFFLYY